jgi:hypothetical protein
VLAAEVLPAGDMGGGGWEGRDRFLPTVARLPSPLPMIVPCYAAGDDGQSAYL